MSFAVWDVIWIVIGSLYGIFAIGWGLLCGETVPGIWTWS